MVFDCGHRADWGRLQNLAFFSGTPQAGLGTYRLLALIASHMTSLKHLIY
jgi:hypothetical protein